MKQAIFFPTPSELRDKLKNQHRLYAYPTIPESNDIKTIIDSGAFGAIFRGQSIDVHHMGRLTNFYKEHKASNEWPIVGVAPDVYLNPKCTIENWKYWHGKHYNPIAPVIQFAAKTIDIFIALQQIKFYKTYNPDVIFISNPGKYASEANGINEIVKLAKQHLGKDIWIHILGAGWNFKDAEEWLNLGVNSIDSIAYYQDAQSGNELIRHSAFVRRSYDHWTDIAVRNALLLSSLNK